MFFHVKLISVPFSSTSSDFYGYSSAYNEPVRDDLWKGLVSMNIQILDKSGAWFWLKGDLITYSASTYEVLVSYWLFSGDK